MFGYFLPENPSEPFGASVIIDGVTYGTGTASSKKLAKNKAGIFHLRSFSCLFNFPLLRIFNCLKIYIYGPHDLYFAKNCQFFMHLDF